MAGYLLAAKLHSAGSFCVGVLVLETVLSVRNSLVLKKKVCVCVFVCVYIYIYIYFRFGGKIFC